MSRKLDAEIAQKLYGWAIIQDGKTGRQYLMPSPCFDMNSVGWEYHTKMGFWIPREGILPRFSENRDDADEAMTQLADDVHDAYGTEAQFLISYKDNGNETEVKYSIFGLTAYEFAPTYELAMCYAILEVLEIIRAYEEGDIEWADQ